MFKHTLKGIWLQICLVCLSAPAQDFAFTVQGKMEMNPLGKLAQKAKSSSCFISISVTNCLWIVRQEWTNLPNYYQEVGTDGANIFFLERFNSPENSREKQSPAAIPGKMEGGGWIHSGKVPVRPIRQEVGILFLAYASSWYLNESTNGQIMPISTVQIDPRFPITTCKASWVRHTEPFGLVEKLLYLGNTLSNYTDLPINFPYHVLTATNFVKAGNVEVPTRVDYIGNGITRNPMTNKREIAPLFSYSFTATNVLANFNAVSSIPKLPAIFVINDNRFELSKNPIPHITYFNRTNGWPTLQETTNTPAYKRLAVTDWSRIKQGRPDTGVSP